LSEREQLIFVSTFKQAYAKIMRDGDMLLRVAVQRAEVLFYPAPMPSIPLKAICIDRCGARVSCDSALRYAIEMPRLWRKVPPERRNHPKQVLRRGDYEEIYGTLASDVRMLMEARRV
jgi:hypothetical protein